MSTPRDPAHEFPVPGREPDNFGPDGEPDQTDSDRRFEEEALPNMDAVYRFALRLTGDESAAEDLVQETFLRAYRSWHQYTPGTRCKSWLFTICRNVHLRASEREERHEKFLGWGAAGDARDLSRQNPVFVSARSEHDPEGDFFSSIVDDEVLRAIEELPEEFRSAVVLSDREGLNYREIARIIEVPVGTVKSRLFRGRRMLQERLHDYAVAVGYLPASPEGRGRSSTRSSQNDGRGDEI